MSDRIGFSGAIGYIDALIDTPPNPEGIAIIGHPHPLFGGTNENKVVSTAARSISRLGYLAIRPNFRGVGQSDGEHDQGEGESQDMLALISECKRRYGDLPIILAGFSFGAWVQMKVCQILLEQGQTVPRLILIAPALGEVDQGLRRYEYLDVPQDTVIIHGTEDEVVAFDLVVEWAKSQDLPVVAIPGASHFFDRRLPILRRVIEQAFL